MKIFLSFHYDQEFRGQEQFVYRVSYYLRKQANVEPYCYTGDPNNAHWRASVGRVVRKYDKLVLFVGQKLGMSQRTEAEDFVIRHSDTIGSDAVAVFFHNGCELPFGLFQIRQHIQVDRNICDLRKTDLTDDQEEAFEVETQRCAKELLLKFLNGNEGGDSSQGERLAFIPTDGLPTGYPFCYEKQIIEEFVAGKGRLLTPQRLEQGCPIKWPKINKIKHPTIQNPIPVSKIGEYRPDENSIIVDVRGCYHGGCGDDKYCLADRNLTFPEAGPREKLFYPNEQEYLRVGIVVSGGIAPGINAVIAGIVQRHQLYFKERQSEKERESEDNYRLKIFMYRDGFEGIRRKRRYDLDENMLKDHSTLGGSMINTSRYDELLEVKNRRARENLLVELVTNLKEDQIDILYVIGGDGSMRAAHAIYTRALEMFKKSKVPKQISVVAIPKTMDNDVLWVWQSFGFLSAVEKAKEFIVQLNTEAKSNPRLCIVQLFGSDSGFVVSHAALASGACMAALIPEVNFTMKKLSAHITTTMMEKYLDPNNGGQSPYGLVLLGETAIPQDVEDYIDNPSYPDLGLEEGEKEAIRRFMGSSLLCHDDIRNWQRLVAELKKPINNVHGRRILDFMPTEVKGILEQASDFSDNPFQTILLSAMNLMLKDENLHKAAEFRDRNHPAELGEVDDILAIVNEIKNGSKIIPGKDIELLIQRMMTVPISCEAREIGNQLKAKSYIRNEDKKEDIWKGISRDDNLQLLQSLRSRLIEKYNRLLLELLFPEQIIARSSSIQRERRVQGQTPDELRTGGLKIVSRVLKKDIRDMKDPDKYWSHYRVFVNEPRHLIRAIAPSVTDVIFGQRLGILAVDNAMAGYTDFMVSQWLTEYVMVPLKLAVLGRKRVPHNGIFWKSVLAGTGQLPDMI